MLHNFFKFDSFRSIFFDESFQKRDSVGRYAYLIRDRFESEGTFEDDFVCLWNCFGFKRRFSK